MAAGQQSPVVSQSSRLQKQLQQQPVEAAVEGIVRLGWLVHCQEQLASAWRDNLACAQQAFMTGNLQVRSHDIQIWFKQEDKCICQCEAWQVHSQGDAF